MSMNKENEQEVLERLQAIIADKDSSGGGGNVTSKGKTIFGINKDILTLVVLVILVVISGVQTAKLSKVQASGASVQSAPAAPSAGGSGGAALPSSLQSLPSQVGGC